MPIKIVPITPDSDAKRRKKTISRIKGTPSERARDKKSLKKSIKNFVSELDSNQSANSISNRDVKILEEAYMKRNDGGIARKTRTF